MSTKMVVFAGTDHYEVPVTGQKMLKLLSMALDAIDQPTGDAINTFIVSHAARQTGLKVALSGLGGDELFGGYPAFCDVPKMLRMRQQFVLARNLMAHFLEWCNLFSIKAGNWADMLDAPANVLEQAIFSYEYELVC